MDFDEPTPSFFGPPPPGAPTALLRFGQPTLFDVIKAIEREGTLSRGDRRELVAQLMAAAHSAPDLKWSTLLGSGLGAGVGYLGSKYLTNLNQKSQMGAAGGGALVGAMLGRAIQNIRHNRQIMQTPFDFGKLGAHMRKKADIPPWLQMTGNVAAEMSGIPSGLRSIRDLGSAGNFALHGQFLDALKRGGSSLGHLGLAMSGWIPFTRFTPLWRAGMAAKGIGKLGVPAAGRWAQKALDPKLFEGMPRWFPEKGMGQPSVKPWTPQYWKPRMIPEWFLNYGIPATVGETVAKPLTGGMLPAGIPKANLEDLMRPRGEI